jgi:LCP family protein required for cell wall assembly
LYPFDGGVDARVKQQEFPTIELPVGARPPSPWRKIIKIFVILAVIFGLLLAGTAVYLNFYVRGKFNQTHDEKITAVDPLPAGEAYNILVLGSDRRSVVDPSERNDREFRGGGSQRADTILLIHVPKDQKSAVLLSFPRDLRVRIPGRSGYHKINASYQGGPNLVIETVKAYTGLPVHHYIEVNFSSFQQIVDAVGGVELCPKRAYNDPQSGLVIKKAGCQQFNGRLALAWARMRKQDPRGDFGRIERQQQFLRVLMAKVKGIGFLTDIPRLTKLADVISKGVKTDSELSLGEVRGIANKLAGFKQSNVDFRVVPSHGAFIGNTAYVVEEHAAAQALFKALLNDAPLPAVGKTAASIPTPGDVTIRVENGTPVTGLASKVRDRLEKLGFDVRSIINADSRDYKTTVILYEPGDDQKAALVAEEFPGATIQQSTRPLDFDVVVILGQDEASRASPSPG